MKVPRAVTDCSDGEVEEIAGGIKSNWVTIALPCASLIEDLAGCVGTRHALGVNSTTAALRLGLEAQKSLCFAPVILARYRKGKPFGMQVLT